MDFPAQTSLTLDGTPGSYSLRELIRDVPLPTNDEGKQGHITVVDTYEGNLYIGTSSGEVLHYVSIPPEAGDEDGAPSYIFATTLEPPYTTRQDGPDEGVKQILLLPNAGKACVVCNSVLTFYTLPELSPAYGGIQQVGCLWVGGLNRNEGEEQQQSGQPTVVVVCVRKRLRLIQFGDEAAPRKIRDIELGGVSAVERRGDLACVADGDTYALLDVVNQRKNDLFPMSSFSDPRPAPEGIAPLPVSTRGPSRSFSSHSPVRLPRGHQRNVSLGNQALSNQARTAERLRSDNSSPWPARRSSRQLDSPAAPSSREESPAQQPIEGQAPPPPPPSADIQATEPPAKKHAALLPNIVSPTPNEFLLTTGTKEYEPGVGIFVNLDGDVVRGTIEFSSYPHSVILDNFSQVLPGSAIEEPSQEGYVLAIVQRKTESGFERCIEFQKWSAEDPPEAQRSKEWLVLDASPKDAEEDFAATSRSFGLRNAVSPATLSANGISTSLRLRRLVLDQHSSEREVSDADAKRNAEEDKLASRFAQTHSNVLLYTRDRVSWVVRTPLIAQLDSQLSLATKQSSNDKLEIDVPVVQRVVNSIRGQDPRDELEFLTLTYVRQKAAVLLFGNLILQTARRVIAYEHDKRRAEDALITGDIDPRVVLTVVPPLAAEIKEGSNGVWMAQGILDTVERLRNSIASAEVALDITGPPADNFLGVLKRYLTLWRQKKGFGSVADESHVFQTVDAALLHLLLFMDRNTPRGPAIAGSVRAELNDVVDKGVDCFDRAVELFEQYQRLYLLSRLYQSRKLVAKVLETWKRIIEGEKDTGGELLEGEQVLRKYLTKIRDPNLVQEYGSWLANRNPKLGVQIFADDSSRVKFEPSQAVAVLKEKVPGAVKDYLEHLVFGKNHVQYVNDLIAYYLDTVLVELSNPASTAQTTLLSSYETYRALRPPKPTYRQFITDNTVDAAWWHNRLRLLQLIGGSHGAASQYNVATLRERLAPYSEELVPEMIILNGREGRHEEALRLLTHGLGDFDTAIRYCLLGGSSIFHPASQNEPKAELPEKEEQAKLFEHLLNEFFKIEDLGERVERSAELLERFGGWFDVEKVLQLIPDDWSVELVSGFLIKALRLLVAERNETVVVKALCSAQNLRGTAEFAEKCEAVGPMVINAPDTADV